MLLNYATEDISNIRSQLCAAKVGEKVPAGLDAIMEDPDFDVRVSFMKAVVAAIDPAPTPAR